MSMAFYKYNWPTVGRFTETERFTQAFGEKVKLMKTQRSTFSINFPLLFLRPWTHTHTHINGSVLKWAGFILHLLPQYVSPSQSDWQRSTSRCSHRSFSPPPCRPLSVKEVQQLFGRLAYLSSQAYRDEMHKSSSLPGTFFHGVKY